MLGWNDTRFFDAQVFYSWTLLDLAGFRILKGDVATSLLLTATSPTLGLHLKT